MKETVQLVTDYGLMFIVVCAVIYFIVKYGSKFLEVSLDRLKNKNYMIDVLTKTVENNTVALNNNSNVIDVWTRNSHKMEEKITHLSQKVSDNEKKTDIILDEIKKISYSDRYSK